MFRRRIVSSTFREQDSGDPTPHNDVNCWYDRRRRRRRRPRPILWTSRAAAVVVAVATLRVVVDSNEAIDILEDDKNFPVSIFYGRLSSSSSSSSCSVRFIWLLFLFVTDTMLLLINDDAIVVFLFIWFLLLLERFLFFLVEWRSVLDQTHSSFVDITRKLVTTFDVLMLKKNI